jgi:hypothetical protein
MPKEAMSPKLKAIRSLFLNGDINEMKDIKELSPTLVTKSLGVNHGRFIKKLYHPEEFTVKHLLALSKLLDLDIQLILNVILKQVNASSKIKKK